jgi:hypothetical protein
MPAAAKFEQERSELESVLASGVFDRAPSLAQVLTYVCSKYFEGEAGQIKEYNIAVEALGRAPEFDPKRDSIVRVEAHRLRKRLREYYQNGGAGHAVQIVIPPGHYTPKFVTSEALVAAPPDQALEFAIVVPWYRRTAWIAPPLAFVLTAGAILFWAKVDVDKKPQAHPARISPAAATASAVRILAGTETVHTWTDSDEPGHRTGISMEDPYFNSATGLLLEAAIRLSIRTAAKGHSHTISRSSRAPTSFGCTSPRHSMVKATRPGVGKRAGCSIST